MDLHTLGLLEFPKIREMVSGHASSSLGKELASRIQPLTELRKIEDEIQLVNEMVEALGMGLAPPFSGLHDIRLTLRKAEIGAQLSIEQLLEISDTLTCTGNIYRYKMRLPGHCQRLQILLGQVEDLGPVSRIITGCIDSRGHVLDMASRELAVVRQKLQEVEEKVQGVIRKLIKDPALKPILRYPNATVCGDHYVLPVAVNHRHKIAGIVHRTSSTGETLFIEPSGVASLSAERTVLKGEEEREIRKILRRLSGEVAKVARPLAHSVEILARLDFVTAKARYSRDYAMEAPSINSEGKLWLRQARHPLLEHIFRNQSSASNSSAAPATPPEEKKVVPIDIRLGFGFRLLVITGPNTGGKTVCLKTAGLLSIMALSGMNIPAGQGSTVPLFHSIMADIGDEQSLEQSLSTFSSHVSRIGWILRNADSNSLILLDELGAGTDPTEGGALGRAILDELSGLGCLGMVTTHLGDLKTYAFNNKVAENGAVAFDLATLRPTYQLEIGQFGNSNALQIARRLKLPRMVIRRAHRYLQRKRKRAPEMIQLQRLREEAEKAKSEALLALHEAEREAREMREKATAMEQEAQKAKAVREWRLRLQPGDSVVVPKYDKIGKIIRADFKKNVVVVNLGLGQWEVPLEDVLPPELPEASS